MDFTRLQRISTRLGLVPERSLFVSLPALGRPLVHLQRVRRRQPKARGRRCARSPCQLKPSRSRQLPAGAPLVSAVVVNWNCGEMLQQALASLFAQSWPALEVILVDNGSTDGSVEQSGRCFGDSLRVIRNVRNEGFARGNNVGFAAARGEWMFLLNSDAVCRSGRRSSELMAFVADKPDVGQLACRVVQADQPHFFDSAGLLLYPDGIARPRGWQEKDHGQYDRAEEVLAPHGCACALRKTMLDRDRRLRRRLLLLLRGPGPRRARPARRLEVLVRADQRGSPQEVGDGRQLLGVQGVPRRAQPPVLPVEVDAALPGVRVAALHAEPLCDAGLRRTHPPGPLGRTSSRNTRLRGCSWC